MDNPQLTCYYQLDFTGSLIIMGVIYRAYRKDNNKGYIGQTINTAEKRWEQHLKEARNKNGENQCWALNNAIRKYNRDAFMLEVVFECPDEDLNTWEVFFIDLYGTFTNGYNLTRGGGHRVEKWRDESKDRLSQSVRVHTTYELPRGVVEINLPERGELGFRVITENRTYTFINKTSSMEDKLKEAMNCYEVTKSGAEYERKNSFKRNKNEILEVPKYITRRGPDGFSVNKPGHTRATFVHKGKTREENLANAKAYLAKLI